MILRTVGQGGMGAVYQARDLRRQTICAIKEMSLSMVPPEDREQAIQNFKIEAKMLAGLHHANLPTFWGFFTEGSRHFLVMEYIDGFTLEDYLERNSAPFPEGRVLNWARQLCDVLGYLHSQSPPIIFRDMKPGNIMLMRNGRIKLIDFGIARFFRHVGSHDTQLLGTPGFAPPEQYGKAQTDERSDIYSLAMTLFQLMTNTLSEKGFGLKDVHEQFPQISLPVARALEKATALAAEDRFQTAEAFRRALLGEGTFMFENGDQATTAEELADLCARFPEEAADYLFAGEIESWLEETGDVHLARVTQEIRTSENDPEEAVEDFVQTVMGPIARIRSSTGKHAAVSKSSHTGKQVASNSASRNSRSWQASEATPDVDVYPRTLDFGEVEPGLSDAMILTIIKNRNTSGQGSITTREPWIIHDRATFDDTTTSVNVRVDTTRLRGSTHYSGTILVIPDQDDEEQDITVKVEVDVRGRVGSATGSYAAVNGSSRKGQSRGATWENEEDEYEYDEADTLVASPGGMVMVPPSQRTNAPTSTPSNNTKSAIYGQARAGGNGASAHPSQASPRQRLWLQRSITVFAAFMIASLWYNLLVGMPLLVHTSLLPPSPWFILVLVGMVPAATLGALVVNWERIGDIHNLITRACTGASTVLLALGVGEFAWQTFIRLAVPPLQFIVMLLVAAVAATFGTHPLVSNRIIDGVVWFVDHSPVRWLFIAVAVIIGGILGFVLTVGFGLNYFMPFGILAGSGIALALVLWVERQLQQHSP